MSAGSILSHTQNGTLDLQPVTQADLSQASQSVNSPSQNIMSTVPDTLSRLKHLGLLTDEDLSVCKDIGTSETLTNESIIDALVNQGKLTAYQADVICNRRPGMLVVGDYIISDRLGAGGMGVVYKAYDRRMHREVAIKMLLESGQQSDEKIERFRREAIAAARMNHPNIVTAYAASEHEGYPYLVMEYIKGRDLGSLVKKGDKLPVAEAVNYILQTARGMEYAHSRHIIHRDLKPSNLLLATPDDSDVRPGLYSRVKILDMGLARLTQPGSDLVSPAIEGSDLSATGMLMGTVDYMAPEQAMDTKRADHRSDIYSLGCTLFFLLTKRPVYTGNNLLERISAHLKAEIPSLSEIRPEVPEELNAVFQKMVAKKPRERYQSMTEVVEALQTIDRQLNASAPGAVWDPGVSDTNDYQVPGSSYGGSRSGSNGSAPTVASGSGPFAGGMPGSSFGSTAYAEDYPTSGTIVQPGMPLAQKLIVVVLLGLMAGAMVALYVRSDNNKNTANNEEVIPAPPKEGTPEPAPIYMPPFAQKAKGAKLTSIKTPAGDLRYYDVIEVDTSQLPQLPLFPGGPAIAEKSGPQPKPGGPAIAEQPAPVVRFRLITAKHNPQLRPFYIMEDKVSSNLFQKFAKANPDKISEDSQWMLNPPGHQPIFYVDLVEANLFANWLGGRLPSGPEWDTAAGFYIPEDDREQPEGPFRSPINPNDPLQKPKVAVYGGGAFGPNGWIPGKPADSMTDSNTDDVGPYGVRYMAGNGAEFTRSTLTGELEVAEDFETTNAVLLRSMPYNHPDGLPLNYEMMRSRNAGEEDWGVGKEADSATSFRVVLPIPKEY